MQKIILGIVLIGCFVWIAKRIYQNLKRVDCNDSPCASCATACDLKRMMEKKQLQCKEKPQKTKKSCHE